MKVILIILIIIFSYTGTVSSYPESQIDECILNALSNPATKSISEDAIKDYCDCFLNEISDKNNTIRESGYKCAQKNFS